MYYNKSKHSVEKTKIHSHLTNISWTWITAQVFILQKLISRNFCLKRVKFPIFHTVWIVKVPYSLYDIPPAWKKVITEPYSHRKVWTKWRKLFATSLSQPQQTEDATIFQPNLPTLYLQFNWTKNQAIHQEFLFRKKFLPGHQCLSFYFLFLKIKMIHKCM